VSEFYEGYEGSKRFFRPGKPGSFRYFCLGDGIVFFLAVLITVFYAVRIYGNNVSAVQFIVRGETLHSVSGVGKETWIYPLDKTVQLDIPGPLGNTVVELKDGQARVISSPCTNQSCVVSGAIHSRGQWIACLPNRVFVSVEPVNAADQSAEKAETELDGAVW
jgi:hypothetical protein